MNFSSRVALCVVLPLICAFGVPAAAKVEPPEEERIERWQRLLPESPRGLGPTIENRRAWRTVAEFDSFNKNIKRAERLLNEPIPELTDQLYLDFSRTGNRRRCQRVIHQRRDRISVLVLAECLENRGRFLPAVEEAIRAVCDEKTWVLPAHDRSLANFKGTEITIDLRSASLSWSLATARYWLGEKLDPEVRKLVDAELERRIFAPFTDMVKTGKPRTWWLTTKSNWNAVCLAGVTGAALAALESPQRRAFFAAAAEKYIQNFLGGFTPDGYCSEGLGYWNYGFGHFAMLAETLRRASGGRVDMMERPHVQCVADFGRRMEILPGVYPAFADCHTGARPDPSLMGLLSRRYEWGRKEAEERGRARAGKLSLYAAALYGFPASPPVMEMGKKPRDNMPPRDWFPDAGVLICRPGPDARRALGAALKGGHNAEFHNHNDVGSFVVALGNSTPLADPGSEVYTRRTFSGRRYESDVLNSFGHPVPRVAGRLQETGRAAAAQVMRTEFTDKTDTLALDLAPAYKVKELQELERTFVFSRRGKGTLTVVDRVEFDSPQTFGTALVTFGKWKRLAADRLRVGDVPDAVVVVIDVRGGEFRLVPEQIEEDLPGGRKPTRLGIELTEPVKRAEIKMTIAPTTNP